MCAAVDTEQHRLCRELIALSHSRPKEKVKVRDEEDVDPALPVHHHLVSSLHGESRAGARATIDGARNLA